MNPWMEFILAKKPRWAHTLDIFLTVYLMARIKVDMECYPTLVEMMAASGAQHTPIRASLKRLEDNGWITVIGLNRYRTKSYAVRFDLLPK
jgi:DNA-binding transcriptional regulator PaaX